MPKHEKHVISAEMSLADILGLIPKDQLDTVEVAGGLTWRQTIVLTFTHGYLRIPGDEAATPPFDVKLGIRQTVDKALRARFAENGKPASAKEAMVFCLGVATDEFAKVCETSPEWTTDKSLVDGLLALWRDNDAPYLTETLAENVLYCMYNPLPSIER